MPSKWKPQRGARRQLMDSADRSHSFEADHPQRPPRASCSKRPAVYLRLNAVGSGVFFGQAILELAYSHTEKDPRPFQWPQSGAVKLDGRSRQLGANCGRGERRSSWQSHLQNSSKPRCCDEFSRPIVATKPPTSSRQDVSLPVPESAAEVVLSGGWNWIYGHSKSANRCQ